MNYYEAAGTLLCKRHSCGYCSTTRNKALGVMDDGPEAVVRVYAEYDGIQCGHMTWAKYYAMGVQDEKETD